MVRGFTPEVCRLLAPHVTVYGDTGGQKINVNSASPELLLAWGNGMAQGDVDRIVEGRAEAPFKSLTDLKDLIGLNAYTALNFNGDLALTSWYYRISSRAEVNEGVKRVEAVVAKNGDKLLFIKVY
jgi:general secretion pathway protein K